MADPTSNDVNPVSLFPSEGSQDLLPGIHSLQGDATNQTRAASAQQFINAQLQRLPQETQLKMMQTQAEIGRQPMEDQKKKEALRQEYAELQGKPTGKFIDDAAELWGTPGFKDRNPFQKAQAYGGMVAQWKQRHPGLELPGDLENYHPDTTDSHLQDAFNMKRYHSEFQQKLQLEREKTAGTVEASRIRGVEAAQIRAQVMAELRAQGMLKENMNPQQEITRLKREKSNPKTSAERQSQISQELEDLVNPLIEDQVRKKWGDESTALILGRGQPDFAEKRAAGMEQDRQAFRRAHGLGSPKAIDETDTVSVTGPDGTGGGTVPRSKLNAYLKANPKARKK